MTECQGCGAWNDTSRTFCVLCGTPLAEIDEWDTAAEPPPLPPLPDGGLRASMPSWLQEPPIPIGTAPPPLPLVAPAVVERAADLASLGPRADPRTFLSDDDFPQWLRDIALRRERVAPHSAPDSAPGPELEPEREAALAAPAPPAVMDAPLVPTPAEKRRGHTIWETLLLVLLFIGVIAAALWALAANGVVPNP